MFQNSRHLMPLMLSAGLVAGLGGCSTLEKHIPGMGAGTPATSGSATAEGVYCAASPDLPLHRSPGGVIIAHLPQYTKLYREQLDRGFARVRVASTGETGWVANAQLTWRLPTQGSPQQAPEPASPVAAESSLPETVEPPEPPSPQAVEPPPSSTPAKGTVAPSIFNPY